MQRSREDMKGMQAPQGAVKGMPPTHSPAQRGRVGSSFF
jgi:hypothetical protein